MAILAIIVILLLAILSTPVGSWSNGGRSSGPIRPDLGTHDLVAMAALCTIDRVSAFLEDDLAAFISRSSFRIGVLILDSPAIGPVITCSRLD